MTFGLGVDLGTTFTAAATIRDARLDMATLGDHAAAIPSVLMVRDDGSTLIGDVADRRATSDPERVVREVKRRFGDPTPLILGGEPYSAAQILARLLGSVVSSVSEREGGRPGSLVLTHPANWGPYKRELFDSVPRLADLAPVSTISEPEAAAAYYASNARVADGSVVAVYDLGGGTFDATVLRKLENGFEFLGPPEGIEGLGGIDFDEAVFAHVDRSVDGVIADLDLDDPQDATALIRLRRECVSAKEALSADTETTISVLLPTLHTEVRLTRAEFEEMIRPPIESTVSALRRALTAAHVDPADLDTVLLVGGSSRIPIVSQMLSAELGRPTMVDTHPKHAVALGAALIAGRPAANAPTRPPNAPPVDRSSSARSVVPDGPRGPAPAPPAPASAPLAPALPGPPAAPPVAVSPSGLAAPPPAPPIRRTDGPAVASGLASTSPPTSAPVAAATPPPTLGGSRSATGSAATRRRPLRIAAIVVGVLLVLAVLVVAVDGALSDPDGLGAKHPGTSRSAPARPGP